MTTMEDHNRPTRRDWVDADTYWSITKFLYDEAEILDSWRYSEWATMITDDFCYQIPVPVTRDDPRRGGYAENGYVVDESRQSLQYWFRRHDNGMFEYAWGENPLQRAHRFVTNVRAGFAADGSGIQVRSNVLLSLAKQSEPAVLAAAVREDLLIPHRDSWLIAHRLVRLAQNVLEMTHMRLIF